MHAHVHSKMHGLREKVFLHSQQCCCCVYRAKERERERERESEKRGREGETSCLLFAVFVTSLSYSD